MIEKIKDWMVWAETYLLWGMIIVLVGLSVIFIWEGINDFRTFNQIMQDEQITGLDESEIEKLNLSFTRIETESGRYRYASVRNLVYHKSQDEIAATLQQADADSPIAGISSSPSFLINEQHTDFWRTQFILRLVLHYGGLILLCIFFGIFGYLNLKQDNKLLTREVEQLLGASFFLAFMGWIGYYMLNRWTISFLNSEFNLAESTSALSTNEIYFTMLALMLAYSLIAKAVPVQEEQDLTV